SFRFPSVAEVIDDTVWITYIGDLQAGFVVQGQGQATENPVFVHKVPLSVFIGIAENKKETPPKLSCSPNPFSKSTRLSLSVPNNSSSLVIYDASGKVVKRFNSLTPNLIWDGRDETGRPLPKGIYFLKLNAGKSFVTEKVILSD
ncbi:MAG: T9SS type A sorting domain-containing protein, partial [candidate division WOR-3 bacterium]